MANCVKEKLTDNGYSQDYKNGLSSVKNEHRTKIKVKQSRNLLGSMDIDKACQASNPSDNRWDYLVVVCGNHGNNHDKNTENLALIEVHGAAKSMEVNVVIKKKEWLLQWLIDVDLKDFKKTFIWLATGSIKILPQSKYSRQLARAGISLMKVTPYLDTHIDYE